MIESFDLYIIFISLLFSAFFSGLEMAFIVADKLQIEIQASSGTRTGKILSKFVGNQSKFIGTILVGNNIALVIYGVFMARLLEPTILTLLPEAIRNDVVVMVVQTLSSTLLVLVTAEFLPKSIFLLNPNGLLKIFALPMRLIYFGLYPFTLFITGLSRFLIVNVLKAEYNELKPVYGLTDMNNYIKNLAKPHNGGIGVDVDEKIFSNALEFKRIRVRDCMIPRTEIKAINLEDGIEALRKAFIESGHSKIIVYKESIDDVIGYARSLELFKKPKDIESILSPISLVPETMMAQDLMVKFTAERKSLAIVIDEYGGTSGLVSLEDVIEEILGEIQDEHDVDDLMEEQISQGRYLLSARLEVDYLNEKYSWALPTGDYETLGGLILSITEDIPSNNDVIRFLPYEVTIKSIEDIRIDLVELQLVD